MSFIVMYYCNFMFTLITTISYYNMSHNNDSSTFICLNNINKYIRISYMSIKKNSFKEINKTINYNNTKHISKVIWNSDLEQDKKFKMNDYINYVKSTDIYSEFNNKINVNLDEYTNYKILGICSLVNNNLKMITMDPTEFMFLLTDQHYKLLFISIGKCHPLFWYKFTNKKTFINNFDVIYEAYNPIQYTINFSNKISGFIGNEEILSLNIHDIENHFILNKYTDKLIWGSKWDDYPFRSEYTKKNVSHIDNIIHTGQAMRQNGDCEYSVSVRTNYSKSIITIYYYDDAFIVELKYNEIETKQIESINNTFGRKYKTNIPIDVIMTLINFPFVTHMDILNMKPLSIFHFYVITLLVNEIKLFDDILPQLNNMVNDKSDYDDITKEYMKDFIKKNNSYKLLLQIINENDICGIIDGTKEGEITELNNIDKVINDIMIKYKCMDNEYIKNELFEILFNNMSIMQKLEKVET